MRELASRFLFVFHTEQCGEFEDVIARGSKEKPGVWNLTRLSVLGERLRRVAIGIEGDENKTRPGAKFRRKGAVDSSHIIREHRACVIALGKKHGDDDRVSSEAGKF